jgi:hypothetical protein
MAEYQPAPAADSGDTSTQQQTQFPEGGSNVPVELAKPGSRPDAPLARAPITTREWKPKNEKALHPKVVKKEANLALHAMRPQPRADLIETVLDVMVQESWREENPVEFEDADAVHEAAKAKYKEMFPESDASQPGEPSAAATTKA